MTFVEIILAIVAAIIIGLIFFFLFRVTGPWGSLWLFLLVLILVAITAEAWITPFGPVYYGFAWIPTLFIILIFALLLGAATPPRRDVRQLEVEEGRDEESTRSALAISAFFWIFIVLLLIAIIAGLWI